MYHLRRDLQVLMHVVTTLVITVNKTMNVMSSAYLRLLVVFSPILNSLPRKSPLATFASRALLEYWTNMRRGYFSAEPLGGVTVRPIFYWPCCRLYNVLSTVIGFLWGDTAKSSMLNKAGRVGLLSCSRISKGIHSSSAIEEFSREPNFHHQRRKEAPWARAETGHISACR